MSTNETENTGNALTIDLGPGTGYRGLWVWATNPTTVTGSTPGYTITLRGSNDKSSWSSIANPAPFVIVAAGEYGPYRIDTTFRYISYASSRGNADNTATAIQIGMTDQTRMGPR